MTLAPLSDDELGWLAEATRAGAFLLPRGSRWERGLVELMRDAGWIESTITGGRRKLVTYTLTNDGSTSLAEWKKSKGLTT